MIELNKHPSLINFKRKISILELVKDEQGVPLKMRHPEFLSLQKFKSISEKDRFLKNQKTLEDLYM